MSATVQPWSPSEGVGQQPIPDCRSLADLLRCPIFGYLVPAAGRPQLTDCTSGSHQLSDGSPGGKCSIFGGTVTQSNLDDSQNETVGAAKPGSLNVPIPTP
jgi:hypothetical protein